MVNVTAAVVFARGWKEYRTGSTNLRHTIAFAIDSRITENDRGFISQFQETTLSTDYQPI